MELNYILLSAKVKTSVRHFPWLTCPVKEIGFAEVKKVHLVAQSVRALLDLGDFILQEQPEDNLMVAISRA